MCILTVVVTVFNSNNNNNTERLPYSAKISSQIPCLVNKGLLTQQT